MGHRRQTQIPGQGQDALASIAELVVKKVGHRGQTRIPGQGQDVLASIAELVVKKVRFFIGVIG